MAREAVWLRAGFPLERNRLLGFPQVLFLWVLDGDGSRPRQQIRNLVEVQLLFFIYFYSFWTSHFGLSLP